MGDRCILIVDDDPASLAGLVGVVPPSVRVLTAGSLEDAVAGMEQVRPLDVVVIAAGFQQGGAVVREARVLHPSAKRMVVGGAAADRSLRAARLLRHLGRKRRGDASTIGADFG